MKRSGSHSWEADNHKVSKHQHQTDSKNIHDTSFQNANNNREIVNQTSLSNNNLTPTENVYSSSGVRSVINLHVLFLKRFFLQIDNINLWPPFSVTVTPIHTTQPCATNIVNNTGAGYSTGMFPTMYYIPAHTGQSPREYPGPPTPVPPTSTNSGPYHCK